jgi:hypothetical protein
LGLKHRHQGRQTGFGLGFRSNPHHADQPKQSFFHTHFHGRKNTPFTQKMGDLLKIAYGSQSTQNQLFKFQHQKN